MKPSIILDQFIAERTGQSVLFNTAFPELRGQCVQLVCFYNTDVLGVPVMWADAIDWWDKFTLGAYFDKIPYPGNLPKRGDIVIFGANTPGSAGDGHIDICIEDGKQNTFLGFDSNWGGKTAHTVTHDYKYVKGFLRPKEQKTMKMSPGTVDNLYLSGWGRVATPEEHKRWDGEEMEEFFYTGGKNQYEYLRQQNEKLQAATSPAMQKLAEAIKELK